MPVNMVQFANQVALALGNSFPPQSYLDATGTPTNPATACVISAISVDAFGVVTITTSTAHNIATPQQIGACVYIAGVTNNAYNSDGAPGVSAFVTIAVPDGTHVKVVNLNAIGAGASSGGTMTVTTLPLKSTFTTAYPTWTTAVTYLAGDIVQPNPTNSHYYKAIQGGISGGAQPAFPTATGAQVSDGSAIIWQEAGLTNATAPPPPGASHLIVYAGSLWAWNTSPTNTATGLDGPCSLRMSDINNLSSWNPINQAFLDKDDGTEGMGIAAFTIAGFGIPPEGSLVAFKQFAGYQIVGVFGSPNFLIQRIRSTLGCIASRTIQFATGFGLIRFSHLGLAMYDGMNDRIVSEDIHPYIFPANDVDTTDITTVDFNFLSIAWAAQTTHPPMYVCAVPIGNSNGVLTRMLCYDLVLKSCVVVDLPFGVSNIYQALTISTIPVTLLSSVDDGCIHRWQAGDEDWDNSIDVGSKTPVTWSVETPMVYNQRSQGGRLFCRQLVIRGKLSDPDADLDTSISVAFKLQGEAAVAVNSTQYNLGVDGTFAVNAPVMEKVTNLDAVISGTGVVELNSFDFQVKPEVATVPARIT